MNYRVGEKIFAMEERNIPNTEIPTGVIVKTNISTLSTSTSPYSSSSSSHMGASSSVDEVIPTAVGAPLKYLAYLYQFSQENRIIVRSLNRQNIECWSDGKKCSEISGDNLIVTIEFIGLQIILGIDADLDEKMIKIGAQLLVDWENNQHSIGAITEIHLFTKEIPYPTKSPTTQRSLYRILFSKFEKRCCREFVRSKFPLPPQLFFEDLQKEVARDANNELLEGQHQYASSQGELEGIFEQGKLVSGKISLHNGTIAKGTFTISNGSLNGPGQLVIHGFSYSGDFHDGKIMNGTTTSADGDVFKSDSEEGFTSLTGQGQVIFPSQEIHGGDFRKGSLRNGIMTYPNGDYLDGIFDSQGMTGKGRYTLNSGIVLEGDFKDSDFVKGRCTSNNGNWTVLEGDFKDRKFLRGKKSRTDENGIERWEEGTCEGEGTLSDQNGSCLTGIFERGEILEGKGIMILDNGTIIEGSFKEGGITEGIITRSNGETESGVFVNYKLIQGRKTGIDKNGVEHWMDGTFEGEGILIDNNGSLLEGIFENGQLIEGTINETLPLSFLLYIANALSLPESFIQNMYPNGYKRCGEKKDGLFHGKMEWLDRNGSLSLMEGTMRLPTITSPDGQTFNLFTAGGKLIDGRLRMTLPSGFGSISNPILNQIDPKKSPYIQLMGKILSNDAIIESTYQDGKKKFLKFVWKDRSGNDNWYEVTFTSSKQLQDANIKATFPNFSMLSNFYMKLFFLETLQRSEPLQGMVNAQLWIEGKIEKMNADPIRIAWQDENGIQKEMTLRGRMNDWDLIEGEITFVSEDGVKNWVKGTFEGQGQMEDYRGNSAKGFFSDGQLVEGTLKENFSDDEFQGCYKWIISNKQRLFFDLEVTSTKDDYTIQLNQCPAKDEGTYEIEGTANLYGNILRIKYRMNNGLIEEMTMLSPDGIMEFPIPGISDSKFLIPVSWSISNRGKDVSSLAFNGDLYCSCSFPNDEDEVIENYKFQMKTIMKHARIYTLSANKLQHPVKISLSGSFNGIDLEFAKIDIPGDGNCGFEALKAEGEKVADIREELAGILLSLSGRKDIRERLANEIHEAFKTNHIPILEDFQTLDHVYEEKQTMLDAKFRRLRTNYPTLPEFTTETVYEDSIHWLKENHHNSAAAELESAWCERQIASDNLMAFCKESPTFEYYCSKYLNSLWLGCESAIIFAEQKKLSLCIWQMFDPKNLSITLIKCTQFANTDHTNFYHLLYSRGNHFDRLIPLFRSTNQANSSNSSDIFNTLCEPFQLDDFSLSDFQLEHRTYDEYVASYRPGGIGVHSQEGLSLEKKITDYLLGTIEISDLGVAQDNALQILTASKMIDFLIRERGFLKSQVQRSTYEIRQAVLNEATTKHTTAEIFANSLNPSDYNNIIYLSDPSHWNSERLIQQEKILNSYQMPSRSLSNLMGNDVIAFRGNSGIGKSFWVNKEILDRISRKRLESHLQNTRDLIHGVLNPDRVKADLKLKIARQPLRNYQVYLEGRVVFERYLGNLKTDFSEVCGTIIDTRLLGLADFDEIHDFSTSRQAKLEIIDLEAPIWCSIISVLNRQHFVEDPCVSFEVIRDGYKRARAKRSKIINASKVKNVKYSLHRLAENGDFVEVARKGENDDDLQINSQDDLDECQRTPSDEEMDSIANTIITPELIESLRVPRDKTVLNQWIGKTVREALALHSQEKGHQESTATTSIGIQTAANQTDNHAKEIEKIEQKNLLKKLFSTTGGSIIGGGVVLTGIAVFSAEIGAALGTPLGPIGMTIGGAAGATVGGIVGFIAGCVWSKKT